MYGYNGTMRTTPGHRDEVVGLLLGGIRHLSDAGCLLYVVSVSEEDPDLIHVNEVWESQEQHRASLQLPETQQVIARARPMLTGDFTSEELSVVGGIGVNGRM